MTSSEKILRLDGKIALVTGGSGGIGEVVSRGLAGVGARVAISGHDAGKAEACAASIGRDGGDALAAVFDARSVDDTRRMVDDVIRHFGRLDILVNCVGLNRE